MSASRLNVENVLRNAVKTERGVWKHQIIPLPCWTTTAGVPLAAIGAGAVGNAAAATSLACIKWSAAADGTGEEIQCALVVPPDFRAQIGTKTPNLVLYVRARLVDAATGDTPTLAITAQCFWHKTGDTALSTLASAASVTIGAANFAAAEEEGFLLFKLDLTGAMSAAQLALLGPLDSFQIVLEPNTTVGTSLSVEIINTFLMYEGHASIPADVLSTLSLS
jgi:hypothetical protein